VEVEALTMLPTLLLAVLVAEVLPLIMVQQAQQAKVMLAVMELVLVLMERLVEEVEQVL
jgi:hypothetical protein